ncbi:hypothetical protein BJF92_13765 [Rhizobium rhizosphaerae]|uniref:Uncharacterized protein n=1 Tax=Xaviernesmea rhizosphaerae TaxID=1672749 RepID=A0A1Q9AHX7_9HYPH|nr:hypothetical protein [Xaviernesmea rhizosphaerae]OLP54869.1 hypothetical protein BJF92_13765 [Xaviernesmea rhizosphaerae]
MKGILAAIARAFQLIGKGADWLIDLPFAAVRSIAGTPRYAPGHTLPDFTPKTDFADLEGVYAQTKKSADVVALNKFAFDTVKGYVKAAEHARPDIDLSALPDEVRITLLSMDDNECKALRDAGDAALHKFAGGRDHRVHGVPAVGSVRPTLKSKVRRERTNHHAWLEEARALKPTQSRAFGL